MFEQTNWLGYETDGNEDEMETNLNLKPSQNKKEEKTLSHCHTLYGKNFNEAFRKQADRGRQPPQIREAPIQHL